jgi:hypothetical protein
MWSTYEGRSRSLGAGQLYDAWMDRDLPPVPPFGSAPPPRPDLPNPDRADAEELDLEPIPRRPGARIVAFVAVLAVTVAALGGGILAIQRVTAPRGDASQHDFLARAMDGSPLRWNPCEPIHYVVNPSAAPEGSIDDVHEAVRQVSRATGITFRYDGLTDELPSRRRLALQRDRYGDRWAPVLIAWVDPDGSDISFDRDGHQAAAVAAPARPASGEELFVSGFIALNLEDANPPGFAWPGAQGPVLLHELGHIMGLAHVDTAGEIMEKSGGGVTGFGEGDLEGLRRVGHEAGCLTTPDPP